MFDQRRLARWVSGVCAVVLFHSFAFAVPDSPFYPIAQVQQKTSGGGMFETEGYVVFVSVCPPCPAEAVCALCPMPFIVISGKNKKIKYADEMSANDLMLSTGRGGDFILGKKYRFKIKADVFKQPGEHQNRMELLDFSSVRGRAPKSKPSN